MDIKTIIICMIFMNCTLAIFMYIFVKVHRTYPGFIFWSLSNLLAAASFILLGLRGIAHDFISIVAANTALALTGIFMITGVRQFFGKKINYIFFILVIPIFLLMVFFRYFIDSPDARIATISLFAAWSAAYMARVVIKNISGEGRLTYLIAVALFILYGVLILARTIELLVINPAGNIFEKSLLNKIYFIFLFLFNISWTTLFLIMNHQRLSRELIAKNNELEESNKIKDRFFAILAHDLKNPFTGIISLSSLLLNNIESKDTAKIKTSLTAIKETAEQTYSLLNNLLLWARTQIGAVSFNPDNHRLNDLLAGDIQFINTAAGAKHIAIEDNVSDSITVYADRDMLHTVLRNVLMNAVKFSYPDGRIIIDARENDNDVVLSIRDSGKGIPREIMGKLFKPGERIISKGTNNEEGSGIGLLLSKEYMKINSGDIWAESEAGNGACFNLLFKKDNQQYP